MAERLARDLADRGLVIASGPARGIDACAREVPSPRHYRPLRHGIRPRSPRRPRQRHLGGKLRPQSADQAGRRARRRWEDVVEELPTPVRAELIPVEPTSHDKRAAAIEEGLGPTERPLYGLLSVDEARHVDDLVENSGLTSSEVLAALFDLELKGVVRQLPGKQFLKVLL